MLELRGSARAGRDRSTGSLERGEWFVATFAGMTPLLLERKVTAQFLIPMATSLGFRVLFAFAISLFLVPASYIVLKDVKGLFRRGPPSGEDSRTRDPHPNQQTVPLRDDRHRGLRRHAQRLGGGRKAP